MIKVLGRIVADALLVAAMLFLSAGTAAWPRAWTLLATLLLVRLVTVFAVYRINPDLLRERSRLPIHRQQPRLDRILVLGVLATGFLGLLALAGLDLFHWHILQPASPVVSSIGLTLFVAGWSLKGLALRANAFAVTVVRLQSERQHTVVDHGVYSIVRHPFYAADPLIFVGSCLWLGSVAAAISAVIPIAMVVARLTLEERFLQRELAGYADYVARVRYRLLPGVW